MVVFVEVDDYDDDDVDGVCYGYVHWKAFSGVKNSFITVSIHHCNIVQANNPI